MPETIKLSENQKVVLSLAHQGKTGDEIAELLNLPVGSVNTRLKTIQQVLGASDITDACQKAVKMGLIN